MTKRVVLGLLVAQMVAAAGLAMAAEETERIRNWALGWEDAIVLRRQLGPWHVGLSARPYDSLVDQSEQVWIVDEPDSLQGRADDARSEHRESGFVGLEVGRRVAAYEDFTLAATTGLRYSWSDYRSEMSRFSAPEEDQPYRQDIRDSFDQTWGLRLGLRLAWRPVPFIGLEAHFGLVYEWHDQDETRWHRDPGEWDWDRAEENYHRQSFNDFGFYDITKLAVMVWF